MIAKPSTIREELLAAFPAEILGAQETKDGTPTFWVAPEQVHELLRHVKTGVSAPYSMLYDLTAIDERFRRHREHQPDADFSVVYHLTSYDRNEDLRIKVPLKGAFPSLSSITDLWPAANWYEREVWDMFGIKFGGHPCLRRILMPTYWTGHPLRKEHPARATEMGPFTLPDDKASREEDALAFHPADWGLKTGADDINYMILNLGPHHPATHGLLRLILALDGEEIMDSVLDIGYHHRGAEKMGERQSWHTYIPYTDRVDYLGGVLNNLPYLLAVEKLAGIDVPDRAKVIRIMTAELFRISNHLVWYSTFFQDLGGMTPAFLMFADRERLFGIIEAICGGRMHPEWFRIGGTAQDLPAGWERLVRDFLAYMPKKLREYDTIIMKNPIFKARTVGVGSYTKAEAIDWGVTGPGLRATGFEWDLRKKRPYSGYEQFDFEIPVGSRGDCYDRAVVHVEEIRQSLRIIKQCVDMMPPGPYKADHPLATPPRKDRTMHDIETLITHFLSVSWGPVIPAGEAFAGIEATRGNNGYYLVSDGSTMSYRTRIRTPTFAHLQMVPHITRGFTIADLIAILGSIDYVLSDVDR